jgi:hypothetical protein
MSNTKWILSVVLLLPGAHSAVLAAPAEQPPNISFVAHAETPDVTRTVDASQYFRPFPRLPAGRNTSIQKAPAPVLAEVSEREFGNPYDMTSIFTGLIDDVRVTARALTPGKFGPVNPGEQRPAPPTLIK